MAQNAATSILTKTRNFDPIAPILTSFHHFLLMSGQTLTCFWRLTKLLMVSPLHTFLTSSNHISHLGHYATGIKGSYLCPKLKRTQLATGLFFYRVPFIWNNLPDEIRQSGSLRPLNLNLKLISLQQLLLSAIFFVYTFLVSVNVLPMRIQQTSWKLSVFLSLPSSGSPSLSNLLLLLFFYSASCLLNHRTPPRCCGLTQMLNLHRIIMDHRLLTVCFFTINIYLGFCHQNLYTFWFFANLCLACPLSGQYDEKTSQVAGTTGRHL